MYTIKLNINNDLDIITNLTKEQYYEIKKFKGGYIAPKACANRMKCYFCQIGDDLKFIDCQVLSQKYDVGLNEHLLFHFLEYLYKPHGKTIKTLNQKKFEKYFN